LITDREIEEKANEFRINPVDVEKDYVYGWILHALYTQSALSNQLILKGGNGLRKAYLPSTRFSKDLDFSSQTKIDQMLLDRELKTICGVIERQTGVRFSPDRTVVKNKNLPTDIDALEARLYFKGFFGEENLTLKAQLDITQFDRIHLPIQNRPLLHPYSDRNACAANVRCQKIEEILASKLTTLLHRRRAADLFDLFYSILFTKEFQVERLQIISTFLKKSIFEHQAAAAKSELLAVPLDEFRPLWVEVTAPIRSLFDFDYIVSNFRSVIESLFSMVIQPSALPGVAALGTRTGMHRVTSRQVLGFGAPIYFAWGVRNAIVAAGRTQTLVELVYDDGLRRLVEPYKIEYYVRKSDGVGLEYFWGYDRTGGKSGPGIKRFICDKIRSVRPTDIGFAPQFQPEF
jgi:predicted nucleotidyltransferase component of viral defense system